MKISITKESKKVITIEEAQIAQKIIEGEKESTMTVAEAAEMAVNAAAILHNEDRCCRVLEATAQISKNIHVWNFYHDDSRHLDVWVEATAQTENGFCIIGAYLSDIYQIASDNREEIARHMFVRWFKEAA